MYERWKLRLLLILLSQIFFLSTARFTNKDPHQTLVSGRSGLLNCSAEGNPAPRFTWTREGGEPLDENRFKQLSNGNMQVIRAKQIDAGKYICSIEQSKGTKQTTSKPQPIDVSVIGKTLWVQLVHLSKSANRKMRSLIDKDFLVIKVEKMPQITFENNYSETKCSIDLENWGTIVCLRGRNLSSQLHLNGIFRLGPPD